MLCELRVKHLKRFDFIFATSRMRRADRFHLLRQYTRLKRFKFIFCDKPNVSRCSILSLATGYKCNWFYFVLLQVTRLKRCSFIDSDTYKYPNVPTFFFVTSRMLHKFRCYLLRHAKRFKRYKNIVCDKSKVSTVLFFNRFDVRRVNRF